MAPVLETHELSRTYGRQRAVDGLTFSLSTGELLALFGPNGAGKTTLLRLLAGLLRPTSGRASIGGGDSRTDAAVRGRVGLISHQTMLYPALTALENVEFAARLHGVPSPREASRRALASLAIAERENALVRTLSRGMQQRVSIARAIVHAPQVLLLDEPYTGLDASGAAALSQVIRDLRERGAAMVLVTHTVAEGLAVASHAAVIVGGKLVKYGDAQSVPPADFSREYRALAGAAIDSAVVAA